MSLPPTAIRFPACLRFCVIVVAAACPAIVSQLIAADETSESVTALINQRIAARWEAEQMTPAAVCSDDVFVRRLYLDLAGRIPTPAERQTFLADGRLDRRAHLVDLLLHSEDHVQHFADVFDTLLMGRGSSQDYNQRRQHQWRAYLERVVRDNRPWNDVAAEILLARPESPDDDGAVWFLYERENDHQQIAEAIAPAIFGIRIECAQCHDHMIAAEIEQRHYWGLVAFFKRGTNTTTPNGPRISESAVGGFSEFADLGGSSSPNLLTFFDAGIVDESRPAADAEQEDADDLYVAPQVEGDPRVPKFSRREQFVSEVLDGHPLVARATVNRVWAMLLGRGIVHPFDEIDSTHPPSHPELIDKLAADFRESDYNMRRLARGIVLSDAYQLESRIPDVAADPALFAWYLKRPLTAEQLARSIQLAVRGEFRNDHPLVAAIRETIPGVLPEESVTPVSSALFLTNSGPLNVFLDENTAPTHLIPRVAELSSTSDRIPVLFETLFGRAADDEETRRVVEFLEHNSDESSQDHSLKLIVWAMLTSSEFHFNH